MRRKRSEFSSEVLNDWCNSYLKSGLDRILFRAGHLSAVFGVALFDGQQVVIKIREPAARLIGCAMVHKSLFQAGFPCPEPLVELQPLGSDVASAEMLVEAGRVSPNTGREAAPYAESLAHLVSFAPSPHLVPSLDPPPPWTAADHHEPDLWPTVDDHDVDLNAIVGPTWVDETGRRVRERLLDVQGEPMIGHGDWYTGNLRWVANRLLSVWDWDSIIVATEPVIAGLAAAVYPVTSAGHESTIEESEQFLRAYADARGRTFSKDDLEVAWAAGLWNRVFDAKKQYAVEGSIKSLDENEARDRLGRAGLLSGSGS